MEIISDRCLSILPLSSEPIFLWTKENDLGNFLTALYDGTGTLINRNGTEQEVNFAFFGDYVFTLGMDRFTDVISEFTSNARRARPSIGNDEVSHILRTGERAFTIAKFEENEKFGLMAKYAIAWQAAADQVLSEKAFFSISHIFESLSELECSMLLAANLYYKQALQVLRSYLEHMVVQIYFGENEAEFVSWKSNQFRIPRLRGREGMLSNLASRGIFPPELVTTGSDLYEALNGSIHSAENRLLHQGMFQRKFSHSDFHINFAGTPLDLYFSLERVDEWCMYYAQCVDFGIRSLKIGIQQWQKASSGNIFRCYICHSGKFNKKDEIQLGHRVLVTAECIQCGNEVTLDATSISFRDIDS